MKHKWFVVVFIIALITIVIISCNQKGQEWAPGDYPDQEKSLVVQSILISSPIHIEKEGFLR